MRRVPDAERGYDLRSVGVGGWGGEPLPKAIYERWLERFGLEILDGIGSTEMCHPFIANRRGQVRPGSSGTVVPGYEAKLVDDAGREVAVGEVGNLMVKGDSACSCYWNQHERTKQTIEGEWVRTGDKYHRDSDGDFWYPSASRWYLSPVPTPSPSIVRLVRDRKSTRLNSSHAHISYAVLCLE